MVCGDGVGVELPGNLLEEREGATASQTRNSIMTSLHNFLCLVSGCEVERKLGIGSIFNF